MAHFPPTRGDANAQLERFSFPSGITASNTYRGMLFGEITATLIKLYKDPARGASSLVLQGTHGQTLASTNTTYSSVTLTAQNSSGIADSTVYFCGKAATDDWEVWPSLTTDTELDNMAISFSTLYRQGTTTFYTQHKEVMEEFVHLMRQRVPPMPGRDLERNIGTRRNDLANVWRVNSVGDYELVRLQNVDDYARGWARWKAIEYILNSATRLLPDEETQLRYIADAREQAQQGWARIVPLVDEDHDLDADAEVRRFKIRRG